MPTDVIRAKFDEIVAFAELGRFIDTPVRNYSSGMYMRLGFSVAAHLDPEIVLVDEALAVGDEAFQRKCLRKIQQFQAQGVTVIIVSHDLLLVERLCARACLLQRGELVPIGPAADVISRYHQIAAASGEVAGEYRWGSREIEIPRVRLLDAQDQPVTSLRTGETLTIAFDYRAAARVSRPVFGLAVYHEDGTHLTGPEHAHRRPRDSRRRGRRRSPLHDRPPARCCPAATSSRSPPTTTTWWNRSTTASASRRSP